ncbi:MAG: nicotinamide riboside transporter PnuC [Cellvibrionaceae bacterium]
MNDILNNIQGAAVAMSGWEVIAATLAIAYLLLAMKQNILCWLAAFISTAIYTVLFWDVSLFMESALNVYYMLMAIYGAYQWQYGNTQGNCLSIQRWNYRKHFQACSLILLFTVTSGFLLSNNTEAAWPYLDSFTTWASVFTTWLVAKKVLENWIYWIVIDSVAIILYVDRGLYLTALLMALYIIIAIFGWLSWRSNYQRERSDKFTLQQASG